METLNYATTFLESRREKELSPNTVEGYRRYLRYFMDECPELPTTTAAIEAFLAKRGEGPGHRGDVFKRIQAFYSYLEEQGIVSPSPVPARGPMGRPRTPEKPRRPRGRPRKEFAENTAKVVEGGYQSQLPSHSPSPEEPWEPTDPKRKSRYNPETGLYRYSNDIDRPFPAHTEGLVAEFINSCKSRGLSERTIGGYRSQLYAFAEEYPVLPLDLEKVEAFWADIPREQDEWKHQLFGTLRTFYYWIADHKDYPPARLRFKLIAPKRSRKVRDNLSNEQVQQLLSLNMTPRDRAIIMLLLEGGPRGGELVSLDRENVYQSHIAIRGKTGEREISIGAVVRDMLLSLVDKGPVFVNQYGNRLSREGVHEIVKKHLAQIGITTGRRGPHMLRHTYGRLYLEHGGDLESLRQQLGHTTLAMTQKYSELRRDQVHKRAMAASPLQHAMRQMTFDDVPEGGKDKS